MFPAAATLSDVVGMHMIEPRDARPVQRLDSDDVPVDASAARQSRLAALEAQARKDDDRLRKLEARALQSEAVIAELGRQLALQQSRRTLAVGAVWYRLWQGVLGAIRAFALGARSAAALWRSRLHAMRIEPLHQLASDGDGFRSLGDDPQFVLYSARRRLPRGWVVISFAVELRGQWLSPRLYVDDGRGFHEERSFALPVRAGRRVECMLGLPHRVRALRLDPLAAPGRFVMRDVTIREVGLVQLAAALMPHLRIAASQPRGLRRLARLAVGLVRKGDARSLTESLLARGREVSDYQDWIDAYDTLSDGDRGLMRHHADGLAHRPLISVLMPTHDAAEDWLRRAIESVRRQLYPHWELCIADDASTAPHVRRVLEEYRALDSRIKVVFRERHGYVAAASNTALSLASGEFVALLDQHDELAERALYLMAVDINAHPTADVLYSDEDKISAHGQRFQPYFKPDWNPDLFLAENLVTRLCVCRTSRVNEVGGFRSGHEGAQDWDLVMRVSERTSAAQIRHVPYVLYHWRAVPGSPALAMGEKGYASAAEYRSLAAQFERRGVRVEILPVAGLAWRIRYPLPQPLPLVSVIIPTRDHVELLRRCVASLRERGAYPRLEIVIVDNRSSDRAALTYLCELAAEPDVTVVRHDAPFNYSALNNAGARHARGDVLVLLNNDVEAISPGWLEEMVSQACRPEIGAVGALLYYPNESIQHAGVVLGLGSAGIAAHAYAFRPRGYVGQSGRALLTRNVSAVTAACLAVRRDVFEEVDGFDETHLSIAYNDLDLCLRIAGRGYRNLWTPYAELYHQESASRGGDDTPAKRARFRQEIEYMRKRWGAALRNDPAYNPNLSLDGESFTLAFPPRTPKPWLDAAIDEPTSAPIRDRGRPARS
jgi:GT2 family glycosyltransferase